MFLTLNLLCLLPVAVLCHAIVSNGTKILRVGTEESVSEDDDDSEESSGEYAEAKYDDSEYSSEDSDSDSEDDAYSEYQSGGDVEDEEYEDDEDDSYDSDDSDDDDDENDEDDEDDEDDDSDDSNDSDSGSDRADTSELESTPIQNLTANVFDNDKALLRWNKIITPNVKDRITNFKVKIQQLRNGKDKHCLLAGDGEVSEESIEIIVPANKTEAVFSGMKKGTTYEIEVNSYTEKGKGPKSMKVKIQRT